MHGFAFTGRSHNSWARFFFGFRSDRPRLWVRFQSSLTRFLGFWTAFSERPGTHLPSVGIGFAYKCHCWSEDFHRGVLLLNGYVCSFVCQIVDNGAAEEDCICCFLEGQASSLRSTNVFYYNSGPFWNVEGKSYERCQKYIYRYKF